MNRARRLKMGIKMRRMKKKEKEGLKSRMEKMFNNRMERPMTMKRTSKTMIKNKRKPKNQRRIRKTSKRMAMVFN